MFDSVEERQHQSFQSVPKAVTENHALQNKTVVAVLGNNDPSNQDQEHEAAYDFFMTGAIYIGLCKHIKTRHPIDTLEARRPATVRFRYPAYESNSDADAPPVWCSILGDLSHLGAASDNEQI
jgi:hypothetical protein